VQKCEEKVMAGRNQAIRADERREIKQEYENGILLYREERRKKQGKKREQKRSREREH
jgi:hypothetical protein